MNVKKPPIERKWAFCPHCGAKTMLYDNTSNCNGVYIKCSRGCKQEFELVVKDGKQVSHRQLWPQF